MSQLKIKTRKIRKSNHVRVSLSGSLEASNAVEFWDEMDRVLKTRPGARVTIDMRDLLFIASCGWALLLVGAHAATAQNGMLVLAGMAPAIERVYRRLNLFKALPATD